jgi:hypothetical protein
MGALAGHEAKSDLEPNLRCPHPKYPTVQQYRSSGQTCREGHGMRAFSNAFRIRNVRVRARLRAQILWLQTVGVAEESRGSKF